MITTILIYFIENVNLVFTFILYKLRLRGHVINWQSHPRTWSPPTLIFILIFLTHVYFNFFTKKKKRVIQNRKILISYDLVIQKINKNLRLDVLLLSWGRFVDIYPLLKFFYDVYICVALSLTNVAK